jgi:hypothetical protein
VALQRGLALSTQSAIRFGEGLPEKLTVFEPAGSYQPTLFGVAAGSNTSVSAQVGSGLPSLSLLRNPAQRQIPT